jgi:hypothetical protein
MVLAVEEDSRQREDYSYEHAEAFYRVNTERHFLVNAMHQLAKILNNVRGIYPYPNSSKERSATFATPWNILTSGTLDTRSVASENARCSMNPPVIGGLSTAAPYLEVSSIQVPSSIPLALSSIR